MIGPSTETIMRGLRKAARYGAALGMRDVSRSLVTDRAERLTVNDILRAKREAQEQQSSIRCHICGVVNVAADPEARLLMLHNGSVRLAHGACVDRIEA